MRKIRNRKNKKQKKMLIIGSLSLLLFLCVGYAAFQTNLSITAKGNIKGRNNLYVSASGSDTKGNGTREKPYQTIQKAYNSAWDNATIYIMTDLQVSKTILFDQNKNITLQSETDNHKLTRYNMTDYILQITSGETTITNLTFDGENKETHGSLLYAQGTEINQGTLTLGENAIFQNNVGIIDAGGGVFWQFFTVNIDGAKFLNNKTDAGGGGFISKDSTVTINYAEIIDNQALNGGGFFTTRDTVLINNIIIKNNSATIGGGINISSSTLTINNGEITGNAALNLGGGISVGRLFSSNQYPMGYLTIYNGKVTNNSAKNGGGIAIGNSSSFTNQSAIVQDNTPDNIYYSEME